MADTQQIYFTTLTAVGEAKDAKAKALGTALKFTAMAVGDGNGALPVPDRTRTALVREVRRAAINTLKQDPQNPAQLIAEQVIPENEGGYWIRELGLYDEDGDLFAIANCPETYKPVLAQGSGRTQVVRMVLVMTSAASVQLKIDPSVVLATRQYVDGQDAAHAAAADPHPQYLTEAEGQARIAAAVAALVNSSPLALDTLAELAAALNNDKNFAATITAALALKAPLDSPALTGNPTAPTPAQFDNDTSLATTAHVQRALGSFAGYTPVGVSRALTAADIGKVLWISNTPVTLTMPTPTSIGAAVGSAVTVFGNAYTGTVAPGAGAAINYAAGGDGQVVVAPGQSATFVALTGTTWQIVSSTAGMVKNADFAFSKASPGYLKLPSGLILQWGTFGGSPSGDTAITFPIAFPNAFLSGNISGLNSGTGAFGGYNSPTLTGMNGNWWSAATTRQGGNCTYLVIGH
jgi:hypothetical protein